MPTSYDDVKAICPYFNSSRKMEISCEGISDGCTISLKFDTKEQRNQHRRIFCDAKYENCELHKILEEKYAE